VKQMFEQDKNKDSHFKKVKNPVLQEILTEIEEEKKDRAEPFYWFNWYNWQNWYNWMNWGNWMNWYNWR
jgi:hypothetical protein